MDESITDLKKVLEDSRLQRNDMAQTDKGLPDWNKEFQNADIQTKRMLLAAMIDKIIVKDGEIRIGFKVCADDYGNRGAEETMTLAERGT